MTLLGLGPSWVWVLGLQRPGQCRTGKRPWQGCSIRAPGLRPATAALCAAPWPWALVTSQDPSSHWNTGQLRPPPPRSWRSRVSVRCWPLQSSKNGPIFPANLAEGPQGRFSRGGHRGSGFGAGLSRAPERPGAAARPAWCRGPWGSPMPRPCLLSDPTGSSLGPPHPSLQLRPRQGPLLRVALP